MKTKESSIQFVNILFKESHIVFEKPGNYSLNINFTPKGVVNKSLCQFLLYLKVNITDTDNAFHINIETESYFTYPQDADIEEYKKSLFIFNAPAIIFPYIRAYISSLTALSGMPTLTLPTLNLSQLGETLKTKIEFQE
jgi:preprotein translocase subunit SecB